jgi:hypothetical protein
MEVESTKKITSLEKRLRKHAEKWQKKGFSNYKDLLDHLENKLYSLSEKKSLK